MIEQGGEPAAGPRHLVARRRLVRAVQFAAVLVADLWLAGFLAGASMRSVSVTALLVCVPAAIITFWWSSPAGPRGPTRSRARWTGGLLVVLAVASIGLAVWRGSAASHPSDPTVLNSRSTCGSALWPRSFSSGPLAGGFPGFTSADDCAPAIRIDRFQAVFLALVGAELFVLAATRPTRLRRSPATAQMPLLFQRPARIGLSLLATAVLASALIATRTQSEVRKADAFDTATAQWSPKFVVATILVTVPFDTMVPDVKARNYAAIVRDCQRAERPLASYETAVRKMPAVVATRFGPDVHHFAAHIGQALDACLRGGKAHDWSIFKHQMAPAALAASADSTHLVREMYIH